MVFGSTHKVKSHRTGRRRKKGGARMPVAPWIVITLVCVLVASGLTWGFVSLLRSGCSGMFRVTVAAAPSVSSTVEDAAQDWEATGPQIDGQCVGIEVTQVSSAEASRGITVDWDRKSLGALPIAWVPDSQAWADWVGSSESTSGYVSSEPVVLGQASSVLAVPETTATELGWLGGQPPTWAEVLDAASSGAISLAAANPRTSTEGLVAMLNASSDGAGGFSETAAAAYSAAVESGSVADSASEQFAAAAEAGDPTRVVTALDHQVLAYNATSGAEVPMAPIVPSGQTVGAVATYVVLGGADWVSGSDAKIASWFGDYLSSAVDSGEFADPEVTAVEDPAAALAQTSPETVGAAVRSWQSGRENMNVLFLIDRSSAVSEESVEYEGGPVSAADAAIRVAIATIGEMESTYQAGFWEYGVGAGDGEYYRAVSEQMEMSDENADELTQDLYDFSTNATYEGGSPLYDSLVAAYAYLSEHAVEGSVNVVVVLTNVAQDEVSPPTVEDTAAELASMAGKATVYTVGFGDTDPERLTMLAEATGGAFVPAPSEGGVLESIGAP
ncbi:hypothetical protein AB0B28_14430 [Glycomyces sp. NPDC046736]|uniref:hypothetical protein n=1 Tax=Glycomyces sp. NPDC046736 TaxID=3155615 RepID=UPI0033C9349A